MTASRPTEPTQQLKPPKVGQFEGDYRMVLSVQQTTAETWQRLGQLASQENSQPSSAHGGDDLPSVAPYGSDWKEFTSKPALHTPHVQQLNRSVQKIRKFIVDQASPGTDRKNALINIQHYTDTRINCEPDSLSALTVNENRRNLNLFAQQLDNPNISMDQKLAAALNLGCGLGVCAEAETLNILDCTQQLCNQQQGMAGVLVKTKNQLVDQHLQQLVKHDDALYLDKRRANLIEIHHVQALKNHVAGQWGLTVQDDRYATSAYQERAGNMASALLEKTITPAVLAHNVAEQLGQALVNHTEPGLATGMPTELLKTEPLRRAIQAEFGQSIELEHCLEFNDDFTEVRLKPQADIALHVVKAFQDIGLAPTDADPVELLNEPSVSVEQAIQQVEGLRNEFTTPAQYLAKYQNIFSLNQLQTTQEAERKRKQQHN